MEAAARKTILRIELWHGLLLAVLFGFLAPKKWIDPTALIAGGLFMALNFWLLSFGVASILTPLAGKQRVKLGVALLVLKIVIFLGLLSLLFFRLSLDPISFCLGFSTLIVAIFFEAIRFKVVAGP